jgi:hypothetical protein
MGVEEVGGVEESQALRERFFVHDFESIGTESGSVNYGFSYFILTEPSRKLYFSCLVIVSITNRSS